MLVHFWLPKVLVNLASRARQHAVPLQRSLGPEVYFLRVKLAVKHLFHGWNARKRGGPVGKRWPTPVKMRSTESTSRVCWALHHPWVPTHADTQTIPPRQGNPTGRYDHSYMTLISYRPTDQQKLLSIQECVCMMSVLYTVYDVDDSGCTLYERERHRCIVIL